jgi:hypothetical protein
MIEIQTGTDPSQVFGYHYYAASLYDVCLFHGMLLCGVSLRCCSSSVGSLDTHAALFSAVNPRLLCH